MKYLLLSLIFAASLARADVVSVTAAGNTAAFTNAQANFAWTPTAVMVAFPGASTGTLAILRYGNGLAVTMDITTVTGAQQVIWLADADFVFGAGSSLVITSSVPGFAAQLHRKPAP